MTIIQFTVRLLALCLIGFSTLAQGKISDSILSQLNISSTISGKIKMNAPDIAENGYVVPITINRITLTDDIAKVIEETL